MDVIPNSGYYTQLHLAPLGKAEAEELLTFLLGSDATLQALKTLILDKTEGTPFFMEEVVQTLAEDGGLSGERGQYRLEMVPTELHISPTVQGVLAARIDRLTAAEKELLQQLSVIGRQFPVGLVKAVVSQTEDELYRLLAALQAKEFLYEQPAFPESEYLFKHALTQDVAYGTVLQEQRKSLHKRTARGMETIYADTLTEHYSALAHHYSQSGNTEKAVEYLHLAGQQAVQRSANAEAVSHLTTAVELVRTLADTPTRAEQELVLLLALGPALMFVKGAAAPELDPVYTRAQELCQYLGATRQLFPVLHGRHISCFVRGDLRSAHAFAEQFLHLSQQLNDQVFLPDAHFLVGQTLFFFRGELAAARWHFERGFALYDSQQHGFQALLYNLDPGVSCLAEAALVLWYLGYPAQALERSQEAIALAQELAYPYSLGFALYVASWLHHHRQEGYLVQQRAEALISLATEHGFPDWLPMGTFYQGWALVDQGQQEDGLAPIRWGLVQLQDTCLGIAIPSPLWGEG